MTNNLEAKNRPQGQTLFYVNSIEFGKHENKHAKSCAYWFYQRGKAHFYQLNQDEVSDLQMEQKLATLGTNHWVIESLKLIVSLW